MDRQTDGSDCITSLASTVDKNSLVLFERRKVGNLVDCAHLKAA